MFYNQDHWAVFFFFNKDLKNEGLKNVKNTSLDWKGDLQGKIVEF